MEGFRAQPAIAALLGHPDVEDLMGGDPVELREISCAGGEFAKAPCNAPPPSVENNQAFLKGRPRNSIGDVINSLEKPRDSHHLQYGE